MILNVKEFVAERKKELAETVSSLNRPPRLLIIQLGNDARSNSYIKGKLNDAEELGIAADYFKFMRVEEALIFLDNPKNICHYDGIIIQEPSGMTKEQKEKALNSIKDYQDVDGFKKTSNHTPCTPQGIINIIDKFYGESLAGVNVAVIGRGDLVGKPLVPMLIDKHATVVSCNSKTENLQEIVEKADLIITAAGQRKLIHHLPKDDSHTYYIIDAGINFDEAGKLCGDCGKSLYKQENVFITPVPGGVGLMTRLVLMKNVVEASKKNQMIEIAESL